MEKFSFKKCMSMMRSKDAQTQEDGFHLLLPHASECVPQLIAEFRSEKQHGLGCWLLELIGSAKSPDAFEFLGEQLRCDDNAFRFWEIAGLKNLNTKESRTLLWEARSFSFETPQNTAEFRSWLEAE
jgi:hypothetical protein